MGPTIKFEPAAPSGSSAPLPLPRSGACSAPLPAWHPREAIMLGGYTEERTAAPPAAVSPSTVPRAADPPAATASGPASPLRAPTMEAWTFSSAGGGSWQQLQLAAGSPVPQPRLTAQAALLGDHVWLVGGWDPSAAPGQPQFLNDVWRLDLRAARWERVEVAGEELPRISRFAMCPLPDGSGRLLLHTHRCTADVLLLETAAQPLARLSKAPVRGAAAGSPSPPSRGLHSLTAAAAPPLPADAAGSPPQARTALYLYGGAPQSGPMFGDLWVLDLESMTWRQLQPEGPAPHARCSHTATAACGGRYLVVVGGSYYSEPGKLQPLDDVAVYDTQANRWVEAAVQGALPSPRNASILVPLRGTEGAAWRFALHGGWRPFVETYNDTYVLTVFDGV